MKRVLVVALMFLCFVSKAQYGVFREMAPAQRHEQPTWLERNVAWVVAVYFLLLIVAVVGGAVLGRRNAVKRLAEELERTNIKGDKPEGDGN